MIFILTSLINSYYLTLKCPESCLTLRGDLIFKEEALAKNLFLWKNKQYYCGSKSEATEPTIAISKVCKLEIIKDERLYFPSTKKLIFVDQFNQSKIDEHKWNFEISTWGGGNKEFQYYDKNDNVTFTKNGSLIIQPRLTSDTYGEKVIDGGILDLPGCQNPDGSECKKLSNGKDILNPTQSGKLTSNFSFKYGKVEARIRLPKGDWLWPAFWFLPKESKYGQWPRSGEIDLLESRGNKYLANGGRNTVSSTLHWGSSPQQNRYELTSKAIVPYKGGEEVTDEYQIYTLEWYKSGIRTSINGKTILEVPFKAVKNKFNMMGNFTQQETGWANQGAPFDQEFYILINLAVGGQNGFFQESDDKPWKNDSPTAPLDFLNCKDKWLPTWPKSHKTAFAIDYVKVWSY